MEVIASRHHYCPETRELVPRLFWWELFFKAFFFGNYCASKFNDTCKILLTLNTFLALKCLPFLSSGLGASVPSFVGPSVCHNFLRMCRIFYKWITHTRSRLIQCWLPFVSWNFLPTVGLWNRLILAFVT